MISSQLVIDSLVASAAPVHRLRSPIVRATIWLSLAIGLLGVFAASHPLRYDIIHCLQQPLWLAMCVGALATAGLGAVAAFSLSIPGRSRSWVLLPVPPLLVWILAVATRDRWVGIARDSLSWTDLADCFATIVLLAAPLSLILAVMLRHAATLRAGAVSFAAAVAVAGVAGAALSLFHPLHASAWLILSSGGVAAIFIWAGRTFGPRALQWAAG